MLKFKSILLIAVFALPSILFAQKEIIVTEEDKAMNTATKNCYIMIIPQARLKDVTEDWKKMVKKDAKGKMEESNGEIMMIGAISKNISASPLTITSRLVETAEGVQISSWFSDGDFISTTTSPDKSAAVNKYLHDFGVQQYKLAVKRELDGEEKKSKQLESVYDGYVKDQKKAESNIQNLQKDIDNLKSDITKEGAKGSNAQTNNNVSKLDADKQKLKSDQKMDKDSRDIEKAKGKIKNEEANITKAQAIQKTAREAADKQNTVTGQVKDKLNNIK